MLHRTFPAWLVACCLSLVAARGGEDAPKYASPPMPEYRVDASGFGANGDEIKAVCSSAGRELWKYFPDYSIERFVVQRNKDGPITLYERNRKGEIVVKLDTEDTYWCQYAYQFAHEFCHVLCGCAETWPGNKWFEETLAEMASLYALRAMAKAWETDPPYPRWKGYRNSIARYVQNVLERRQKLTRDGLKEFYGKHKEKLRKESCLRDLNGAMAVVLLELFEAQPEHWEAVRWLNTSPAQEGDSLQTYLQKWHNAAPERHQEFIREIGRLYGVEVGPED